MWLTIDFLQSVFDEAVGIRILEETVADLGLTGAQMPVRRVSEMTRHFLRDIGTKASKGRQETLCVG